MPLSPKRTPVRFRLSQWTKCPRGDPGDSGRHTGTADRGMGREAWPGGGAGPSSEMPYILDIDPLLDISLVHIFFHLIGCLSVLLMVSFAMQKFFSLM